MRSWTSTMKRRGMSLESVETVTVRATSESPFGTPNDFDSMDIDSAGVSSNKERIIIATDFGTTFSAVAFACRGGGPRPVSEMIANYQNDPIGTEGYASLQVPTESWYYGGRTDDPNYLLMKEANKHEVFDDIYSDRDPIDGSRREDPFGSEGVMDFDRQEYSEVDDKSSVSCWGYVKPSLLNPGLDRSQFNRIAKFKLLLDTSDRTQKVRDDLRPFLERLKNPDPATRRQRIIERDEDVIVDYLVQLFRHTKEEFEKMGIPEDSVFEHVLCVPAVWNAEACCEMQNAVSIAVEKTGLGSMRDFFLVSEPEAAAAFVLDEHRDKLNAGEAFLLLDAGGGTVDATTYTVTERFPLRLSDEVVPPDGCLEGSSFVNAAFREHLRKRLEGVEHDIEINGCTLDEILDEKVDEFERQTKRNIDVSDPKRPARRFLKIQGIEPNKEKGFMNNTVIMERNDFNEIFGPILNAIGNLMENQLRAAKEKRVDVQKVILVGGFSASNALRSVLQRRLKGLGRMYGYEIELIVPIRGQPQTAVVQGAILRAWDKDKGPRRFLQLSYGFQVTEEYNPDDIEAHRIIRRPTPGKHDGIMYVNDTIDWLLCKGEKVDIIFEKKITVYHTFLASDKVLEFEQFLWVSASSTESHYQKRHEKNKDARIAGRIVADMTFLKTQNLIQPTYPEKGFKGKKHYKVEFELCLIIEGRNLRFEARWPPGEGGQKMAGGQVSIAAAFKPGTM